MSSNTITNRDDVDNRDSDGYVEPTGSRRVGDENRSQTNIPSHISETSENYSISPEPYIPRSNMQGDPVYEEIIENEDEMAQSVRDSQSTLSYAEPYQHMRSRQRDF